MEFPTPPHVWEYKFDSDTPCFIMRGENGFVYADTLYVFHSKNWMWRVFQNYAGRELALHIGTTATDLQALDACDKYLASNDFLMRYTIESLCENNKDFLG